MKNKSFGHLKTILFTIKTSKNIGVWGAHGISNPQKFRQVGLQTAQPRLNFYMTYFGACALTANYKRHQHRYPKSRQVGYVVNNHGDRWQVP